MEKKTFLSILKVLAEAGMGVAVEEAEIVSKSGLPHAIATRTFFEMTEQANPMIEKVDSGDGMISYRLTVEPELVGINLDLHDGKSASAAQIPEEMHSQDADDMNKPTKALAPAVGTQRIGSYTFGVNKISDDMLRMLLETPTTGADLLEKFQASGDLVLAALDELESASLVSGITMELDSEKVYSIADDYREDIDLTLLNDFVYPDQPLPRAPMSVVRAQPAPASQAPSAPDQAMGNSPLEPAGAGAGAGDTDDESSEGLGAVAIREAAQRKASIALIYQIVSGGKIPKKELFDTVLPHNTVRKLKLLFEEMIESRELEEIQEGRNKYIVLGEGAKGGVRSAPRPAERQPQVQSNVLESISPRPADVKPASTAAPAPAPAAIAAQHAPEKRPAASSEVRASSTPAVPPASMGEGVDLFAMFTQMQHRLVELEAENRVYREFMDKLSITAHVA